MPIAIIEAKDNNHAVGAGMQQALGCANTIQITFVFSSNGDGFLFHDKTGQSPQIETTLSLSAINKIIKQTTRTLSKLNRNPTQKIQ